MSSNNYSLIDVARGIMPGHLSSRETTSSIDNDDFHTAASSSPPPGSPVASPVKGKKAAKAVPAPSPAPAPAPIVEEEEWIRKTISGKKYLWNPSNNHCYRCEADGSQGEWVGLLDPKNNKIDDSVEEPVDFEE
jgi:hypothetical protein